jgi:uncharacterized protein (DUF433 family)
MAKVELPMIDLNEWIAIDPEIRGGKPCIRGTRITVYDILEYMAGGMSEQEILADFPSLKSEHLRAALMFAVQRERRLAGGVVACCDLEDAGLR